ncbi:hypothetical protein GMLC_00580 [Geomonas limicola]|uniref:Uncharacterized protein n=1 Tax=Geomonas limicola TaxID=2740186 RepID=A0A6V8N5A4_9BACT|nr:hypothetical protein GMLC_00580 [Geomonas limicola]
MVVVTGTDGTDTSKAENCTEEAGVTAGVEQKLPPKAVGLATIKDG